MSGLLLPTFISGGFFTIIGVDVLVRQHRRPAGPRPSATYLGVIMVVLGLICASWALPPILDRIDAAATQVSPVHL